MHLWSASGQPRFHKKLVQHFHLLYQFRTVAVRRLELYEYAAKGNLLLDLHLFEVLSIHQECPVGKSDYPDSLGPPVHNPANAFILCVSKSRFGS